ncbi:MAG: RNA-binding protein [Clostridiaceae bacterium]|nr:RNA-binding protein [Clostridiaceae bacterium]
MDVGLGQIVFSKAGRDEGKKFIIVGILDGLNVLVSDGDLRRIEKAKKKKIKHLNITDNVNQQLKEKLVNNLRVSNSEIRKALSETADIENKSEA